MHIGNKIKQLRQRSGITQEQLANKIGVCSQTVSKWENAISMPDITLLPILAEEFGVSIDELFDLTVEERMRRIESRLEKDDEISGEIFKEYEQFLLGELEKESKYKTQSLLAHLYHHRMQSDAQKVKKYAQKAITLSPEKKDCQWLLNLAQGQRIWDWNVANHSEIIDFYKKVIENDKISPKTSAPYYYLIDNLLADNRTEEVKKYLNEFINLPSHNVIMAPIYKAHIAFLEHDDITADKIIEEGMAIYGDNGGYLFEVAQFYAGRADYEKALEFYERSWALEEKNKPRFTDTLEGIATIYGIMGEKNKVVETYDRLIKNLKEEWNYANDDFPIVELENKKRRLLND